MDENEQSSPTDNTLQPVHVVAGSLDDSGMEPHFPSSKSMDNMESIILENPLDEDSDDNTSASADQFDSISEELPTEPPTTDLDHEIQIVNPFNTNNDFHISSTPMKAKPNNDGSHHVPGNTAHSGNVLSQYFMTEGAGINDDENFFDSLAINTTGDNSWGGSDGEVIIDEKKQEQKQDVIVKNELELNQEIRVDEIDDLCIANTIEVKEVIDDVTANKLSAIDLNQDVLEKNIAKTFDSYTPSGSVSQESLNTFPEKKVNFNIQDEDEDDVEEYEDDVKESHSSADEFDSKRVRTTSCSEEIEVAFEESKGLGMTFTKSTKSLSKFFAEDADSASENQDTEGKTFFDTFTAAEGEEEPGDNAPCSLTPTSTGGIGVGLDKSASDTSLPPPETPPIIQSTSPFHSQPPTPLTASNQPPVFPVASQLSQDNSGPLSLESDPLNIQVAFDSDEDAFSQSLKVSDDDRRYDAWIPSDMTRQVFITIATNPPGSYIPTAEHLTMLGITLDEPQGDPVKELLKRFRGDQEAAARQTLGIASVPQNEEGLRQLINAECYRAAVDLTGVLLTQCGQGSNAVNSPSKHTPYSMQVWLVRISLLMKLRQYSIAETECQSFGGLDKPDLFYEYYTDIYPGRKGSMVPFKLRLLHAELPLYLGKTQESLDRLHYLHAIVSKILSNLESGLAEDGSMVHLSDNSRTLSRELWHSREVQLLYSIGNCLLNIKDFTTALEIYELLLKKDEQSKSALLCGMGRIYLQMGDIRQAQSSFVKAEELTKDSSEGYIKSRNLMNKGFLALGHNQFKEAQQHFKEAVDADPHNGVAVNNMAVTSLYTGKLKEALNTLENLIESEPEKYLQEGILFNLCTLYELESSQALHKKQKLLELVSKYKGNGFNVACLKMA